MTKSSRELKTLKVFVDSKEVRFFIINPEGKIIRSGDSHPSTWESTRVSLDSIKVGTPMQVWFNKTNPTELAYNTTKVEEYKTS